MDNCAATESQRNQEAEGISNPSASLCGFYLFSTPLSEHRRFYFKAYWQLQQHLTLPEHSSVHRSRCHITALGMVSAGWVEWQQNPGRSRIPAGFVSPAHTSGL